MNTNTDLHVIAQQEDLLIFDQFDADTAWVLGQHVRQTATSQGVSVAIEIRLAGQLLFHCAMPGTTADNTDWIRRKSNVCQRFQKSSYVYALKMAEEHSSLQDKYGLDIADFTPHGGAFPLRVKGAGCIGSITVSGIPQRQDHNLVVLALSTFLKREVPTLTPE
jgi:uncharacterized protein (UPF0303 family)